jgi:AraC-like DNA-binding protein
LPPPDPEWPPKVRYKVRYVAEYVHEHLFEGLRVGEVKRACCVRRSDFSGRFSHFVGHSPKAYILTHRLVLGKQLLRDNEFTILSVALAVGFGCHSALTKAFQRHEGCAPSTYRHRQKK